MSSTRRAAARVERWLRKVERMLGYRLEPWQRVALVETMWKTGRGKRAVSGV